MDQSAPGAEAELPLASRGHQVRQAPGHSYDALPVLPRLLRQHGEELQDGLPAYIEAQRDAREGHAATLDLLVTFGDFESFKQLMLERPLPSYHGVSSDGGTKGKGRYSRGRRGPIWTVCSRHVSW